MSFGRFSFFWQRRFFARDAFRQTIIDNERRIAAGKQLPEEKLIWRTNLDRPDRRDLTDSLDRHLDTFLVGFVAGALFSAWATASLARRSPASGILEDDNVSVKQRR